MPISQVTERLQATYQSLSPQLRQAARYLLDHPEEIALTSMRRIALHAGVKPSTMVRLARAVGYEGFEEMREPYRRWLRGGEGAFEARARSLHDRGEGGAAALLREMAQTDTARLGETATPAMAETLIAVAATLAQARRVYVMGLRSCFALAHYFHYTYGLVNGNARLVDGAGGTFLDSLRGVGAGDVLLAFSFRPYARDTVEAVDMALAEGAAIVAMTDSRVSPIARAARHVMLVDTASPNFFQSLVAPLSLTQQLLAAAVVQAGESGVKAIKDTERRLMQQQVYWQEPRRRRPADEDIPPPEDQMDPRS